MPFSCQPPYVECYHSLKSLKLGLGVLHYLITKPAGGTNCSTASEKEHRVTSQWLISPTIFVSHGKTTKERRMNEEGYGDAAKRGSHEWTVVCEALSPLPHLFIGFITTNLGFHNKESHQISLCCPYLLTTSSPGILIFHGNFNYSCVLRCLSLTPASYPLMFSWWKQTNKRQLTQQKFLAFVLFCFVSKTILF